MKKILVLLAIVMVSCSTPSTQNEQAQDCKCGSVVSSSSFNVAGTNGLHQFSVITVKNNCTGVTKQIQRDGVINVGNQICNY